MTRSDAVHRGRGFFGRPLLSKAIFATLLATLPTFVLAHWWGGYSLSGLRPGPTGFTSAASVAVFHGRLVYGGTFSGAGRSGSRNIAAYDGTRWWPLGGGIGNGSSDDNVSTLLAFGDTLIAGGRFSFAENVGVNNVARWDGVAWQAMGNGVSGAIGSTTPKINALAVYQGQIIAAGHFTTAGTQPASHVARWNETLGDWEPLGSGLTWNPGWNVSVSSIAVCNDGGGETLYIGGTFAAQGGNHVARWDEATQRWIAVGGGANNTVDELLCDASGQLVAGGLFTDIGGRIARWDGTQWNRIGGAGFNDSVLSLGLFQGELIAGGYFTSVDGMPAQRVARWDGTQWHAMGQGFGDGQPARFAVYHGRLFAGGTFTIAGGRTAQQIAWWEGSEWIPLATVPDAPVDALVALTPEQFVAGGAFAASGMERTPNVARWDGLRWHPLGDGPGGTVFALALDAAGTPVAGGAFPGHAARWNGVRWQRLGRGLDGDVLDLEADGTAVLAGGRFTGFVARWDGAHWTPLDGLTGAVHALVRDPNLGLLAGGEFPEQVARRVGGAWQPLGTGLPPGTVRDFAIDQNGVLFCVGDFADGFAQWNGSAWVPISPGTDGPVNALIEDGPMILGGSFTQAGPEATNNIAGWAEGQWDSGTFQGGLSGPVHALIIATGGRIAGGEFPYNVARHIDCPLDPNADFDGDGICGDVDNCPNDYNPGQQSGPDGDNIPDACDTCPAVNDPLQADADADGAGDACDCAPANPFVKSIPAEVSGLLVAADRRTLTWSATAAAAAGRDTGYDLLRGRVDELPVGSGLSEQCLAQALIDATAQDPALPPSGVAYWYLVRAANACGQGTWGADSAGAARTSTTCP